MWVIHKSVFINQFKAINIPFDIRASTNALEGGIRNADIKKPYWIMSSRFLPAAKNRLRNAANTIWMVSIKDVWNVILPMIYYSFGNRMTRKRYLH